MEITIEVPLGKPLKSIEKMQLLNSFVQDFVGAGIARPEVKESYFVDRRSPIVPEEGVTSFVIGFSLDAPSVQIMDALESLIEVGKPVGKKLSIRLGRETLVDTDGNLLPDDYITKLIWNVRNVTNPDELPKPLDRLALVYGNVIYYPWSNEVISVIVTVNKQALVSSVVEGRARGLIACARVNWFSCSICDENFEDCEHKTGEKYGEKVCVTIPRDIQFLEESVTDQVVDSRCRVTDLLVFGKDRSDSEWYGFQDVNIIDRLKTINNARKDKIISDEAARKFRFYFSRHSVGRCKFRKSELKVKARATSRRK